MIDKTKVEKIEVDMRGQVCPSTLLVAMDSLNKYRERLQHGTARLLIKSDNREATHTIPSTAENMGYVAEVRSMEGYYEILISPSFSDYD